MVLTVSFVLSPETGLFCLRHRRNVIRRFSASVGAPRPHDFAVRTPRHRQKRNTRPPHPAPNVVTMANAPLVGSETGEQVPVICPTTQGDFFGDNA
jgi:hypothetical protein